MMMRSSSNLAVGAAVGGRIRTDRRLAAPSSDTLRRIAHPDRSVMILMMILLLLMLLLRSHYRLYICLSLFSLSSPFVADQPSPPSNQGQFYVRIVKIKPNTNIPLPHMINPTRTADDYI